ncbi:MAG: hypothetical protein A3A86_06455 [Elusimicrobia bacterium RIFCSPLOWO2_01_FULL_60_11]|nr:MAG: hypothetical protein A3A86_06455 [Elusimicrobia bacterium RIFCSPLOWO2_01_FULL_60_11]
MRWVGVLLVTLLAVPAFADAPKISGFVDTTFNYDLNRPASRTTSMRSFDRKTDNFLLNNAQVQIDGSKDGIGYMTKLDYGTDASVLKSAGTGADAGLPTPPSTTAVNFEVQEAYLTYKCPVSSVMLKAGKFVTTEGIEVIESKDNFTISRGHLFGLAEPYTHTGIMAGYDIGIANLWVGAVNGWDNYVDNNYGKTLLAKIGLNISPAVQGSFSLLHGAEKNNNTNDARTSIDTTWFFKPMDKTTIGVQFNYGQEDHTSVATDRLGALGHWYGFGLQPKFDVTDKVFVGGRYEWFSDLDGARTGATHIHQNITLSPGVNLTESLMFRVEYRYNWATASVYEGSDGLFSKSTDSTLASEFIFKF